MGRLFGSIVSAGLIVAAAPSMVIADSRLVHAFPGAEGFGALTRGGRGGKVVPVTTLEEYDPKGPAKKTGGIQPSQSAVLQRESTPDEWEKRYEIEPTVANDADDTDGDGYTDLEEFLNGTHPRLPATTAAQRSAYAHRLSEGADFWYVRRLNALLKPGTNAHATAFENQRRLVGLHDP
jgi:hypothetical protein